MRVYLELLKRRPHFRLLWGADVVSWLGDWLSYIAVSLLSLNEGGSTLALAMVLVLHSLPYALLAPIAGPLADRMDRRTLMLLSNIGRFVLTLGMAGAALFSNVWLLQLLLLLRVSLSGFFLPAHNAALPRIVERSELLPANALASATWSTIYTAGVALGGVLAALVGPTMAILLDASTFVVASVLLWFLPKMPPEQAPPERTGGLLGSFLREMWDAVRYAAPRGRLLESLLAKTPIALAGGGGWVLLNLLADDLALWGSAAMTLGLLQASRGIGTGVGPLLTSWLTDRGTSPALLWEGAAWVTFGSLLIFSLSGNPVVLVVIALVWGAGAGANWVTATAKLQELSPDRFLGRLSAWDFVAFTAGQSLAALLGAALVDGFGTHALSAWLGLALGVPAWLAMRAFCRSRMSEEALKTG